MTDIISSKDAQELVANNIIDKLNGDLEQRMTDIESEINFKRMAIVGFKKQIKALETERETVKRTIKVLK